MSTNPEQDVNSFPLETRLQCFALQVLGILEDQKDWSSDTPDDIAAIAMALDLADVDEDGRFRAIHRDIEF